MFGNKSKPQVEVTVIGKGTVIEGKVSGSGRMQIDGRIEGIVDLKGEVSVGPNGSVQGELITDELAVGGKVQGKVEVRGHLRVLAGGSVHGQVRYASLQIDRGGVLGGTAMHGEENEVVVDLQPSAAPPAAVASVAVLPPPPLPAAGRLAVS